MSAQGLDPNKKRDDRKNALTESEIAFRKDLASGKMVWTGHLWTDFWYFFITEHAIFSWFCFPPYFGVPDQHPFSKKERICVLVIGLCWAFTWSSLMTSIDQDTAEEEKDGSHQAAVQTMDILFGLCVSIICGISVKLATCSCVQGTKTRTRTWCERIGCILNTINLLFALFVGLLGIIGASKSDIMGFLFLGMIKSNLYSWFGWDLLFCIIKFFIGWIGCGGLQKNYWREKKIDRINAKLCIHWKDYAYYIDTERKGNPKYSTLQQKIPQSTIELPVQTMVIQQQPVQTMSVEGQPIQAMVMGHQPVQKPLTYYIGNVQEK